MKNLLILICSVCCFILHSNFARCQQPDTGQREKVHLHTDQSFYRAGDTLWFKAYVVQAVSNMPSAISKVIHIELFGANGVLVARLKLPVLSGLAHGDIALPDSLKEGGYRLRAYTNWMRNFGEAAFFEKDITLLTGTVTEKVPIVKTSALNETLDAGFFPEGGELVAGLRSRVGVKITGTDGKSRYAEGEIIDEENNIAARFTTAYAGMGSFVFTPQGGKKYTAHIKLSNGTSQKKPVPVAKSNGYVLAVNNMLTDTIFMSISQSAQMPLNEVLLSMHDDAKDYFLAHIIPKTDRFVVAIPRKEIPEGVTRVTLYTKEHEPVAERLLFNDTGEALNIKLSTLKKVYKAADSTEIELQAVDKEGKPASGSFSMAVVKAGKPYYDEDELSIRASLLLTSDVRGYIEHPNYYFTAQNKTDSAARAKNLDDLLLTQGWRRFVLNDSLRYNAESGLTISGTLLDNKNRPLANSTVRFYATTKEGPILVDTLTDAAGRFVFNNIDFSGAVKYLVQTKDVKNKYHVKVLIDTVNAPAPPPPAASVADTLFISQQRTDAIRSIKTAQNGRPKRGILLKEVLVKAKKPVYSSSGGRIFASKVIDTDKIKGYISLVDVLRFQEPRIKVDIRGTLSYDSRRLIKARNGFAIMIDGNVFYDNELLSDIKPEDVESIEIHLNGIGTVIDKGVIVINTKGKSPYYDFTKEKAAGINTFIAKGYSVSSEFYVPKYDPANPQTDLRDVVYWAPAISTDSSGKASIKFYQGDKLNPFRVIVEGITGNGKMGRAVYKYNLNN
ncbi:MG2 domain-containing protein [Mucilaginibacter sp. AK015]|uniref:MG2 domain-containing protein n=1 Tax=Mucilaginibacter sp. AK015 TaxID=2723072 RepID=UPI00160B8C91|nr:MG2 domain-containing protein [Mucilaginibacter sp. AK015]MBB5397922.1 hypothetical protein [Mucilaginibacter sp. AK015]